MSGQLWSPDEGEPLEDPDPEVVEPLDEVVDPVEFAEPVESDDAGFVVDADESVTAPAIVVPPRARPPARLPRTTALRMSDFMWFSFSG
jgi:hypothetical protein